MTSQEARASTASRLHSPPSTTGATSSRFREWRRRRLAVHLAALREPLRGLDLDDRDQATLTRVADRDAGAVGAIVSLLTRARAAFPSRDSSVEETTHQHLAGVLAELREALTDDVALDDFLELLSHRAAQLLKVSAVAVIAADLHHQRQQTAASSEKARRFVGAVADGAQADWDATRRPQFTHAARESGFGMACAVPVHSRSQVVATLILFDTETDRVDDTTVQCGQALADAAIVGVLHRRAPDYAQAERRLHTDLQGRSVIDQATGVLAERWHLTAQEASTFLHRYARANNQQVADLACSIVDRTIDPSHLLAHRSHLALHGD